MFRHIFHNWPDSACHQILKNTVSALEPGYSRVIIIDVILPHKKVPKFNAFIDISMMAFGGMERTEIQWRDLLQAVGLSIRNIRQPERASHISDSVIEAILAE